MDALERMNAGGLPERARRLVDALLSGRNPNTRRAYARDLDDFRRFLGSPSPEDAARTLLAGGPGVANEKTLAYRAHLQERGLAPATVNRRLASVRSLVKLGRLLGLVTWDIAIPGLRTVAYRDTRGPGREGFLRMLAPLEGRTDAKALRGRAILRLAYSLALRRGEVSGLDLADVDLEAGTLAVLGKGRTEKERLTLPPPTREALAAWIGVRGTAPGPLFLNFDRARKGARLTGASVNRVVRALGRAVGLDVHAHGLRHAGITRALDLRGGDVRGVARFSRHRDVRTLTLYDDNRADLAGQIACLVDEDATLGA